MDWRVKVVRSGVVSRLPFESRLRRVKRKLVGYRPDESNLRQTADDYAAMAAVVNALGRSFEGSVVLEIGSGWFPTIPLLLARDRARHVYLSDLSPHMDHQTFQETAAFVARECGWSECEGRAFADFPFTYLAPFEPGQLRDGSVDFVVSRTVLEHVPTDDLGSLLAPLRSKLSSDGLMVHLVDHSDHLAHGDHRISMVNFLTWSAGTHRVVNWIAGGGENRLRHHEYPKIFEDAGFDVVTTRTEIHEPTRRILPTLPLAQPYAGMPLDTLATLHSIYVLRAK